MRKYITSAIVGMMILSLSACGGASKGSGAAGDAAEADGTSTEAAGRYGAPAVFSEDAPPADASSDAPEDVSEEAPTDVSTAEPTDASEGAPLDASSEAPADASSETPPDALGGAGKDGEGAESAGEDSGRQEADADVEEGSFTRYAGIWREDGKEAGKTYIIRNDGRWVFVNDAGEYDRDGEIRLGEEEIGGTVHRTVGFYDSFGEFVESFYDDGGDQAPLADFQFGNGDGERYVKEEAELSSLPIPEFRYTGEGEYLALITEYQLEEISKEYSQGDVSIPAPMLLHVDDSNPDDIKVFGNFWLFQYDLYGRKLINVSGGEMPSVFHFARKDGGLEIMSVEKAGDGAQYGEDIARFCEGYDGLEQEFYNTNGENLESVRKDYIEMYREDTGLLIDAYQDFGWQEVALS